MKALVGPVRLVLLHCGKFDFAEVDLSAPLHLVGPNNVGKTSLIALLQLLYLDDQRSMYFSRDMADTRRYYFPDQYSYVLFECLTPTGFQVLGVHGLGPVRQYDFERFAYQGRVDLADFLDDKRQSLPAAETFARLSSLGFTRLEPRHLRAALTGLGEDRGVHLGLVPARRSDTYERFRKLFINILRLSHIKQDELKGLLLSIYESEFEQMTIDLAQNYASGFEKVQRDSREVQELKLLQSDIEALLQHIQRRDRCRETLPALWQSMGSVVEARRLQLTHDEAELRQRQQQAQERSVELRQEVAQAGDRARELATRLGGLRERLDNLDVAGRALQGFMPEWAEQQLTELCQERDKVIGQLSRSELASPEQLRQRIGRIGRDLDEREARLRHVEHALVHWLRERYDDADIKRVFAVLNQKLLALPTGGEGARVRIIDEGALGAALKHLLEGANGGKLSLAGVEIALSEQDSVDLQQYGDKGAIETAIRDLRAEREEQRASLEAVLAAEKLRQRRQVLETDIRAGEARLTDWHKLQVDESQATEWRSQCTALEAEETELRQRMARAEEERLECLRIGERVTDSLQDLGSERSQIDALLQDLRPPQAEWPLVPLDEPPSELEDLAWRYRRACAEEQSEDGQVREHLDRIEARTYGRYVGADEATTVARLGEQLDSVPAREQAVRELWTSIAVGIKKSVSSISRDLDKLKTLVQRLNQQIARVPVSNLSSLRLIVEERKAWVRRIRGISLDEDMPLFANPQQVKDSFEELGHLLSEHPRIGLDDLFDLQFEVGTPDGGTRRHAHLDAIESNGTTVTIKVLTNLALLQGLLDGAQVRIPFYLDECSSLDKDNLTGLVHAADDMGFVAVLASPDAMDAARRLYFLEENEAGRVILDPRTALVQIGPEPEDE
jgi:hypothetical protein